MPATKTVEWGVHFAFCVPGVIVVVRRPRSYSLPAPRRVHASVRSRASAPRSHSLALTS